MFQSLDALNTAHRANPLVQRSRDPGVLRARCSSSYAVPFALTPITDALPLPWQQRTAWDLSGKLRNSSETSAFHERERDCRAEQGKRSWRWGRTCRGASYLCPLPAEMHQHGRRLVDLTPVVHPTAGQNDSHSLSHGRKREAGGFPGEPQIAVHLCSLPGVFYSAIPPPGAGGAGRVGLNFLLAGRFYFQCHGQGM